MISRSCKGCKKDIEEERIDLLDSYICAECANKGAGQETLKAATIYVDGAVELEIMTEKSFTAFSKAVKTRDNAHGCH